MKKFRKCFSFMKIFLPFAIINFIFYRYAWWWGKENIWKVSLFDLNSRFYYWTHDLLNKRFCWMNVSTEQMMLLNNFSMRKRAIILRTNEINSFFERLWLEQDGSLMNDKGTKWKKFNIPISMWQPSEHWAHGFWNWLKL